jgi:predicted RNA-binding Zn-ribbon protein involved in translation (DUF1610 family)
MESNQNEQIISSSTEPALSVCSVCHQPILLNYYFCPNCGAKIKETPLSTSVSTQAWIYLFSIILPMIAFIFVGKWQGIKYFKSNDPKAKQIGQIAWILIVLSTILTIWLAYVWTQKAIQSSINSINTDFNF